MSDLVVDEAGREERHVNTIRVDGHERVAEPRRGYSVRASWRDPYTLETVGLKDGQPIGGATYAVSPDGQTLTISADQQRIVVSVMPDTHARHGSLVMRLPKVHGVIGRRLLVNFRVEPEVIQRQLPARSGRSCTTVTRLPASA